MTRDYKPCRKYREELCAVLSGELPAEDRAGLENHLEACADCQRYRDEIGSVTAVLAAGGELIREVQPRETTQARWARDFEAAVEPAQSMATKVFRGILDWSRDIVWPCRRIWAGMAAIWIVILGLNASQRTKGEAQASHRLSPETMRALLAREGFLPGPGRTVGESEAESSRPLSTQPRSDRQRESNRA